MTTTSTDPLLLVLDADDEARERTAGELRRRYSADYEIRAEPSAVAALDTLVRWRAAGGEVALILADQWLPGLQGADFLARAGAVAPAAKRGLLVKWGMWGDRPTADAILHAMSLGQIDYYVLKPWRPHDEQFHRTIAEFLHEYARANSPVKELTVVAPEVSPRAHELRDLLTRNGVPHAYVPTDSERGRALLAQCDLSDSSGPSSCATTAGRWSTPATRSWPASTGSRPTSAATASSTSWWWAPGRAAWPRRCTRPRRACARSSSSASRSAARPGRAR
jgi:thioredoxin reductase (NADPH)